MFCRMFYSKHRPRHACVSSCACIVVLIRASVTCANSDVLIQGAKGGTGTHSRHGSKHGALSMTNACACARTSSDIRRFECSLSRKISSFILASSLGSQTRCVVDLCRCIYSVQNPSVSSSRYPSAMLPSGCAYVRT
jgi:hypothetical protein